MGRIVMPEDPVSSASRPGEHGFRELAAEMQSVQTAEYLVQIVDLAGMGSYYLSAARAFILRSPFSDLVRFDEVRVRTAGSRRGLSPVELRNKDVREAAMRFRRHVAADLRDADENFAVTDSNSVIYPYVGVKSYIDIGNDPVFVVNLKGFGVIIPY